MHDHHGHLFEFQLFVEAYTYLLVTAANTLGSTCLGQQWCLANVLTLNNNDDPYKPRWLVDQTVNITAVGCAI